MKKGVAERWVGLFILLIFQFSLSVASRVMNGTHLHCTYCSWQTKIIININMVVYCFVIYNKFIFVFSITSGKYHTFCIFIIYIKFPVFWIFSNYIKRFLKSSFGTYLVHLTSNKKKSYLPCFYKFCELLSIRERKKCLNDFVELWVFGPFLPLNIFQCTLKSHRTLYCGVLR